MNISVVNSKMNFYDDFNVELCYIICRWEAKRNAPNRTPGGKLGHEAVVDLENGLYDLRYELSVLIEGWNQMMHTYTMRVTSGNRPRTGVNSVILGDDTGGTGGGSGGGSSSAHRRTGSLGGASMKSIRMDDGTDGRLCGV